MHVFHRARDIRTVVHGDDFTVLDNDVELDWFHERIAKRFEVKFRARLGPQAKNGHRRVSSMRRTEGTQNWLARIWVWIEAQTLLSHKGVRGVRIA